MVGAAHGVIPVAGRVGEQGGKQAESEGAGEFPRLHFVIFSEDTRVGLEPMSY